MSKFRSAIPLVARGASKSPKSRASPTSPAPCTLALYTELHVCAIRTEPGPHQDFRCLWCGVHMPARHGHRHWEVFQSRSGPPPDPAGWQQPPSLRECSPQWLRPPGGSPQIPGPEAPGFDRASGLTSRGCISGPSGGYWGQSGPGHQGWKCRLLRWYHPDAAQGWLLAWKRFRKGERP